jgi:hypothetical protein
LWLRDRQEARKPIPANERSASAMLRVIAAAEEEFRNGDHDRNGVQDYWTRDVAGLCKFGGPGRPGALQSIPADLAAADGAQPGCKPRNGYYFKAIPLAGKTGFACCAYPADYDRSGKWTFVLNEKGQFYRVDTGGQPIHRWAPDSTWLVLE